MHRIRIRLLAVAATLAYAPGLFFPAHINAAPPPPILHHQSVIHVDGSPFEGAGTFKFALVSADGLTTYWSHDGTSAGGAPPTGSLTLNVAGGRYAVQLGAAPMEPIPAALFSTYNDAHLRTWFDDEINGSELLVPDRPLAAGAYAWHAATADQVTDGAITTVSFAPGTIASLAWGRSGNAGTTAGTDFIGTTDDVPLEFRVDNREVLTLDRNWNWLSGSNHQLLGGKYNWTLGEGNTVSRNSVALGNENDITKFSYGFGENHIVSKYSMSVGAENEASEYSVAFGMNNVANEYSFAGGHGARALHRGSFVWSDSRELRIGGSSEFDTTAPYQFLIDVDGGVGINTNAPATALDVNGTVTATTFAGDASGLSGLDSVAWSRTGNAGMIAGTDFIGTRDDVPLEFRVNSEQAIRIDHAVFPNTSRTAVNLILGNEHLVDPGAYGVAIGGGNLNAVSSAVDHPTIGGGFQNTIEAGSKNTIGGGQRNSITEGISATIGGGTSNIAGEDYATVPGGHMNSALGRGSFAAGRLAAAEHAGSFVWSDGHGLQSTGVSQFLIGANGGVGINTNAPATALDVNGTVTASSVDATGTVTSSHVHVTSAGAAVEVHLKKESNTFESNVSFSGSGTTYQFGTPEADRLRLWVENHGEVWTALPNGNIGIGTENPTEKLEVAGNVAATNITSFSSRRWKENIRPLEDALETVGQLRGVRYAWKEDGREDIGLIAEEVGAAVPEIVTFEDNGEDARGVDYSRLVAVLVEGMKAQQLTIEDQSRALAKQEQTIEDQSRVLAKVQQQMVMLLEAHRSQEKR